MEGQKITIKDKKLVVPNSPSFHLLKVMVQARIFGPHQLRYSTLLLKKLIMVSAKFSGKKFWQEKSHLT